MVMGIPTGECVKTVLDNSVLKQLHTMQVFLVFWGGIPPLWFRL